jgi:hypothetical protein
MKTIIRTSTVCITLFCMGEINAQELSTASYVGALEGAAQACAEAFPVKAPIYRDSLYRSMKCHLGPAEFAQWRERLRTSPAHGTEYQKGYSTGKASLASTDSGRVAQCRSLESLGCDPKSPPHDALQKRQ